MTFNGVPSSHDRERQVYVPGGMFCKHGVALLLVAARGIDAPPPTVSWRTMFSGCWRRPGSRTSSQVRPLALCFGVETPNGCFAQLAGSSDPMLMLYPMTMGKRGKWIKTGPRGRTCLIRGAGLPPAQEIAVTALHRALTGNSYSYGAERVGLSQAPVTFWTLLEAAQRAGVTLIADPALRATSVRVTTTRLSYTLRAHATGRS